MKQGLVFEDLEVGQTAQSTYVVTARMIEAFAELSGDDNPLHLDEIYAAETAFGERIAHGMLSAGFISAVIGAKLPGYGSIYISQSLRFKRPVKIGDEVVVEVAITGLDDAKARASLSTTCRVGGKAVVEGEALVLVPRREG
jgi:3-hydroxybutyryl-CoA dehydratase